MYSVYEHVFPNGKKYIGISKEPEKRWANGIGYKTQGKVWKAIQKYGWENIQHNIICEGLSRETAQRLEEYLIAELDTVENGYNATLGGDNILTTYLNEHVLFMIRESKRYDEKYGEIQPDNSIVSFAEKGKYNAGVAYIVNLADEEIEKNYPEYKKYHGRSILHDFGEARVDCYWWTMKALLTGEELIGETPYWDAWAKNNALRRSE